MLISKFDIYKSEWLELVFDDRNKAYGAYELRQHYSGNMIKAMCVAFAAIGTLAIVLGIAIKPVAEGIIHHDKLIPVVIDNFVRPAVVTPPKKIISHVRPAAALPHLPVPTKAFIPFVVTPRPVITEPPTKADLQGDIGPVDIKGPAGPGTAGPTTGPGGDGTGTTPGIDVAVYPVVGLERMPEPYGGSDAWSKFLKKHLIYPDMAIDQHMQGRVLVSFIIEKDGHLSNFNVDRGAGFGMDEEALRVLKLSPAWKPGIQNGQPVRVKYTIPINFQMPDDY
jgi:protein TonB